MISNVGDEQVAAILKAIGVPLHAAMIEAARTHIIRGMGKGAELARRAFDDDILDAPDPARALAAELGWRPANMAAPAIQHPTVSTATSITLADQNGFFLTPDSRRSSEVIDEVLDELKLEGIWSGVLSQQRRIMQAFAWIMGDKQLSHYPHLDVAAFKKGLQQLPAQFYFGTPAKVAMSGPFSEVIAELPPMTGDQRRSHKTVNRDLWTMATVARHLTLTSWKPRMPGATVMDFGAGRIVIKRNPNLDPRPPWTTPHLNHLFRSPLYTGGGGALNRLRDDGRQRVVRHDADYWVPLLCFYHHSCREETCGLEIADICSDHAVPYFEIRDNLTVDVTAKRRARSAPPGGANCPFMPN